MGRAEQNKFYEKYIIDAISTDGYDVKAKTAKEKMQFLKDTFKSEYGYAIAQKGEQGAMADWLSGLPSAINIPFEYSEIIDLAKKAGTLAQNATDAQESKVTDNYFNYMANKIRILFKKYKVR